MQDLEFTIELDKKGVRCALNRSEEGDESVCFVIGHGASGDLKSGNLPAIAKSLEGAGISVLRYNAGGQLKSRVKVLEVRVCFETFLYTLADPPREDNSRPGRGSGNFHPVLQALLSSNHTELSCVRKWILAGHSMVRACHSLRIT